MLSPSNSDGEMSMKNAQQYWSKHLAAIKAQGITTSAYARKHNLALASLYHWQHKLRSTTSACRGSTPTPVSAPTPSVRQPSKFISLRIDPVHDAARTEAACTLILSGGLRLEMSTLPDPQWLAAVQRNTQEAY
jgi:transposase